MKSSLRSRWRRYQFRPGPIGFLTNPYYLMRRMLWRGIKQEAALLSGRVLDVGCGSKPYRELFHSTDYVGMDVDASGHDHTDEDIDVFYQGREFPFEANSFDVVFMSEVLEHVPDVSLTLMECRRVLRPQGVLLLTMPFLWGEHEMPYDHRRLTSIGLANLVSECGFSVCKQQRLGGVLESVVQLAADALTRWVSPKTRLFRAVRSLFIAPGLNVIGTVARLIAPGHRGLYLGHLVVARLEIDNGDLRKRSLDDTDPS